MPRRIGESWRRPSVAKKNWKMLRQIRSSPRFAIRSDFKIGLNRRGTARGSKPSKTRQTRTYGEDFFALFANSTFS